MSLISKQVPVIQSDAKALSVARELAAHFKRESTVRDRERRLPFDELELFSHTGLWGISVPKAYGGAGVSNVTLAEVVSLISAADSSLGQIPQNHFYALEVLLVNGSEAQKQRLYTEGDVGYACAAIGLGHGDAPQAGVGKQFQLIKRQAPFAISHGAFTFEMCGELTGDAQGLGITADDRDLFGYQ